MISTLNPDTVPRSMPNCGPGALWCLDESGTYQGAGGTAAFCTEVETRCCAFLRGGSPMTRSSASPPHDLLIIKSLHRANIRPSAGLLSETEWRQEMQTDPNTSIVTEVTTASTFLPAYDGNGNVMALVDTVGDISATYEYDPFGRPIRATGPAAQTNPFRFSTKFTDDETGLCYYGYRYYDATLGRWLGRDPLREKGGLNLYSICRNNTTSKIDKLGLEIVMDCNFTELFKEKFKLTFKTDFTNGLYHYKEAKDPTESRGSYAEKHIQALIIARMMASPTSFAIGDTDNKEELKNLGKHIQVRVQSVLNSINKKFNFGPSKIVHTVKPPPDDLINPGGYYNSINNPDTSLGCFDATTALFFAAIGSLHDATQRNHNDIWIPGDWGYIANLNAKKGAWDPGHEGENIIHHGIGQDGKNVFWGHFNSALSVGTLEEWRGEISRWENKVGLAGSPSVDGRVYYYPTTGLEKAKS